MLGRVIVFYVMAFVFTVVLGGVQEATQVSSETIILAQWGPGLAALLMLLIFRKDRFRINLVDRGTSAARYALALALPLIGAAAVYLIYRIFFALPSEGEPIPWTLLLWFPLGAIGEELGWRGYLAKRLNGSMTGLLSSVIVGVLWAAWHFGNYQNGALYTVLFVILMVAYSIVIHALAAPAGFSVALASVFHVGINIASLASYSLVNRVEFMLVSALVWTAIAVAVVLIRPSLFVDRR